MKIVKSNNLGCKSWGIKLYQIDEQDKNIYLNACDCDTEKFICGLIVFNYEGKVYPLSGAYHTLKDQGYNPHEHGNEFNKDGKIIIGE